MKISHLLFPSGKIEQSAYLMQNQYRAIGKSQLLDRFYSQNWEKLSDQNKEQLMNRVCELRAEEHGIPSPRVSLDRGIRYGGYAGRRNEIYVNLEACLDSEKIFDTVVDEVENSYRLQCGENEPQE